MNKRNSFLIVLLIVLPFVMAACGGGDVSEDDAEKTIKAAFEGDIDEANKFICDDDKMKEEDFTDVGANVDSVECKKDGDKMNCDVTLSMEVEGVEESTTLPLSMNIEDGKLCGGDIGVQ